ncbi:MAG: Septin 4 [Marteilia pararefringens]
MDLFSHIKRQCLENLERKKNFFTFNVLFLGEPNTGKSNFIKWFLGSPDVDFKEISEEEEELKVEMCSRKFKYNSLSIICNITLVSNVGLMIDNSICAPLVCDFVECKFLRHLELEITSGGCGSDQRFHLMIYFARNEKNGLAPLDIEILKKMGKFSNLFVVIGKCDSFTEEEKIDAKNLVINQLKSEKIHLSNCDDVEDSTPFWIFTAPIKLINDPNQKLKGREYPWGTANMFDESYNDYNRLCRNILENMYKLINWTHNEKYYEFKRSKMQQVAEFFQKYQNIDKNELTSIVGCIELIEIIEKNNIKTSKKLEEELLELRENNKTKIEEIKKMGSNSIIDLRKKLETKQENLKRERQRRNSSSKKKNMFSKFI